MVEEISTALPQAASKTEDRILKNALKHFCDFGYTGTSVRDITAASEVTKPTLYYYFKNKEELYTRLATSCFDLVVEKIKSINYQNGLNLEQSVDALFDAYEAVLKENRDALKFIYSVSVSPQRGSPEVGVQRFNSEVENYLKGIVQKAIASGECVASKSQTIYVLLNSLFAFHTTCLLTGADTEACVQTRAVVAALCACAANEKCFQLDTK